MAFRRQVLAVFGNMALIAWSTLQPVSANEVGVREMKITSIERGTDLTVTVWYPASRGGEEIVLGENPFFVGTSAMLNAPVSGDRFPLVLLSHGAGLAGTAAAISWIAAPLAKLGFVVAAPTHPGNSGPGRSAAETMKLWLRPADISATLDAIEKSSIFLDHLKPSEIAAVGLSMGGGTALALVGARFDPTRLAAYCDTDMLNPSLCGWVRQSGVNLHAMNLREAGRDARDKRFRSAIAIDPAPTDVFDPDSFSRIEVPVELVNLGRNEDIPRTAQAAGIARAIPDARYTVVEEASHYSMFAECKPGAAATAEAEDVGDPICSDGDGQSRLAIHSQLIDLVAAALNRTLRSDR